MSNRNTTHRGSARVWRVACAALGAALLVGSAQPARAGGHFENGFEDQLGRILAFEAVAATRQLLFYGAPVPAPVIYAPPRVVYHAPPPVVYAPAPVVYAPPVYYAPAVVPVPVGYGHYFGGSRGDDCGPRGHYVRARGHGHGHGHYAYRD
jgi:hypothetical protein